MLNQEQLKALGVVPVAWRHNHEENGGFEIYDEAGCTECEPLITYSDLMKVCAAYEARIENLKAALDLSSSGVCNCGTITHEFGYHHEQCPWRAIQEALYKSSPLTALEADRKRVRYEAITEVIEILKEGGYDVDDLANFEVILRMAEEAAK